MMRMPSTLSSTTVVRSPTWSWARRATSAYRRSKTTQVHITGTAGPRMTSPSTQSCISMITRPTRMVTPLTNRNVNGKARNMRSSIRSVVPRESSWPDAQRSWKATGSRCRCRYRSARISASTCDSGRATSQRRMPNSTASATPSSSRYSAPSHTPAGSRSATGPSTIHFRTSGITSPVQEARTATNAAVNSRTRTGRTYGHSRSRVRTAERSVVARVVGINGEGTDPHRQRPPSFGRAPTAVRVPTRPAVGALPASPVHPALAFAPDRSGRGRSSRGVTAFARRPRSPPRSGTRPPFPRGRRRSCRAGPAG